MRWTVLFLCLGVSAGISSHVSGQVLGQDMRYSYREGNNSFISNVMLNEISPRAFRHFKRNYSLIVQEKWLKSNAGFTVVFSDPDSAIYYIHYDPKGRYENTYVFYQKNIPVRIGAIIKFLYEDYAVYCASSMNDGIKTVFDVALVNSKMIKTVEISGDGHIKVVSQYENAMTANIVTK